VTTAIFIGTVQAGNASGFNPWPSVISPVSLAEYAPDSPQSNSGDLTLAASNTGGDRLAVVILNFQGFDGFSAGGLPQREALLDTQLQARSVFQ